MSIFMIYSLDKNGRKTLGNTAGRIVFKMDKTSWLYGMISDIQRLFLCCRSLKFLRQRRIRTSSTPSSSTWRRCSSKIFFLFTELVTDEVFEND